MTNELINQCLYNWLGYGNCDGDLWFIGTEEGGAEIWRDGIATLSLEDSLRERSKFPLCCSLCEVWEDVYKIPFYKFKGITTWHFMCAFLLAMENKKVDNKTVTDFLFTNKSLGALDSNHFMCELLPLPKKAKDHFPYTSRWGNLQEYMNEVTNKRFSLITEIIEKNQGAKLIIVYDNKLQALIKDKWGENFESSIVFEYSNNGKRPQKYLLHSFTIANRTIRFLYTPFFGNGLISYTGIVKAVEELKLVSYIGQE